MTDIWYAIRFFALAGFILGSPFIFFGSGWLFSAHPGLLSTALFGLLAIIGIGALMWGLGFSAYANKYGGAGSGSGSGSGLFFAVLFSTPLLALVAGGFVGALNTN